MEKVNYRIYQLTLMLMMVSMSVALLSSGRQREFFYFAVYASIIGLFLERKKINFHPLSLAYPFLFIGILNLGWYLIYEYPHEGFNFYNSYLDTSKKLILGSLLIFYTDQFRIYVTCQKFQKMLMLTAGIGFILASGYAFWQAYHGHERAEMALNRATLSAYLYSVLSLTFVYSLYVQRKIITYLLAAGAILISYIAILMTGTRSAMGLYFILTLFLTLYHFRKIHFKSAIAFIFIATALCGLSYKTYIKPKIDQTNWEINSFQEGQDNTSLGARFSMWAVGIQNGLTHPLGQSLENRTQWTANYVQAHPHLASSMLFINVHMHNEFIEKYSLQGIAGVLILFLFFAFILVYAIRKRNALLLTVTLFLLLYGLTDVLLLSSEGVIFFLVMFALSNMMPRPPS